jgi:hypothetical protein
VLLTIAYQFFNSAIVNNFSKLNYQVDLLYPDRIPIL